MRAESHNPCQASSQEAAPFSAAETEAMEILAGCGIDFNPVYIGRARPYLNCGHHDSKDPKAIAPVTGKSAEEIVSYVIELINLDEDQRKFLERALENKAISELRDRLTLSEADRIATQDLANALREMVDQQCLERGYDAIEFDLYWSGKKQGECLGKARIGNKLYQALGVECHDAEGRKVLRIRLRAEKRNHV